MLAQSLAFIFLCISIVTHGSNPKKPNAPIKTSQSSLTEEQLEDQIFARVSKREARVLFTRAGAKNALPKKQNNYLYNESTSCTNR